MMTKKQYLAARRLIRDNGNYAIRWMNDETALIMTRLQHQQRDQLAEREWFDKVDKIMAAERKAGWFA